MKRLLFTILMLLYAIPIQAQETVIIGRYNNSETVDLGNGHKQLSYTNARSFYVEKEYDISGNIIAIRNISGNDTIAYVPSNFSQYFGEIINGNYVDNFVINDSSFTLTLENDFDVYQDSVTVKGDTIVKHIKVKSKNNKIVMNVVDIKGIDSLGGFVSLKELKEENGKIKGKFDKKVKHIDPTWSWQPDGTSGVDAYLDGNNPTTNSGTSVYYFIGGYAASKTLRIFIKFTIGSDTIAATDTIKSAKIIFTVTDVKVGSPSGQVHAFLFKRTTVESQITHTIASIGDTFTTPGAYNSNDIYMSDSTVTTSGVDFVGTDTVDITNCVRKILGVDSAYANNGILLKLNLEPVTNYGRWGSSEETTPASRPKIIIDYTEGEAAVTTYPGYRVWNGIIQNKVTNGVVQRKK